MRSFFVAPILAMITALCLSEANAQTYGLHNSSKRFTDPENISVSDMTDPKEIQRTWEAAVIRVPTGPGRSKAITLAEMQDQFGDGQVRFPTAIHMHGCSGIWPGTLQRVKFLADNGFLAIAPASMARKKYAQSCNPITHQGGMFRPVLQMRQMDAGYAIETAKSLPFVDPENMILTGLSEGGITTATFKPENDNQRVAARVIEGWTCTAGWYEYGGVHAPDDEPVLALVGKDDPWFQDRWTKGSCTTHIRKDNGSQSIVYETGRLAARHELLEFREVQDTTMAFLRLHVDLPLSVAEVQTRLSQLGYDPGPVDGAWGGKTLAALNALRADHAMDAVSELDASSQDLLRELSEN